jgi:hypothetical protein
MTSVLQAHHDISFPLKTQLILKLQGWVSAAEFIDLDPSGIWCALTCPADQQFMPAMCQVSLDHFGWCWTGSVMTNGGQHAGLLRRRATIRLQQANVEHIVQLGTWWKL